MSLLMIGQGYPPAILVALLLHGLLLYVLLDKKLESRDLVNLERPASIAAVTTQENPQRLRRLEQERQQRAREAEAQRQREAEAARERERQAQAQREAEAQRQAEAERQQAQQRQREAEAQRQREAEAARQEQARREQAEQERAAREQAAREQAAREQAAREQAVREEAARREAAQRAAEAQASAENQAIQSYTAVIHDAIRGNWVIPPSARNGMTVLLNIRLVPTGEIIDVNVLRSSGDPVFDRSAVQAVRRTERFPELQQMPLRLFEREFRSFNLLFRPEDLLR